MIQKNVLRALLATLCLVGAPTSFGGERTASAEEASQQTRVVTLRISGMMTKNCPLLVEGAVRRVDGVEHVKASLADRTATVRYKPSKTSPEAIRAIIVDRTGFDAELIAK